MSPYRLSDGTDISQMKADEIEMHLHRLSSSRSNFSEAMVDILQFMVGFWLATVTGLSIAFAVFWLFFAGA